MAHYGFRHGNVFGDGVSLQRSASIIYKFSLICQGFALAFVVAYVLLMPCWFRKTSFRRRCGGLHLSSFGICSAKFLSKQPL